MNKKGKNKKNKTNPVPNEEAKSEEKVEVVETVESVESPEVASETAVVEVQDDAPKKPKRNRGKKKKGKDDDEDPAKEEHVEEVKPPPVESIEEKPAEIIAVVPTTRKKKNKKKGNEPPEESAKENVETIQKETPTDELLKSEVKEDIVDFPPISEVKEELITECQKPAKKKNKKKKRNDSEKSDKEEVSCTTAFQKLMDVTDPEENTEDKVSSQLPLVDIPLEDDVIELKFEENKATTALIKISSNEEKVVKESSKPESKSKKKNKKDKKQAQIEDIQHFEPQTDDHTKKPTNIEILTENITEAPKDTITGQLEPLVEETNPTPKAKIAKPVEKKRKEKLDIKDNIDITSDLTKSEETGQATGTMEPSEQAKIEVIDILDIPSIAVQSKGDDKLTQELIIPDNTMGKKRKKSPKVPKQSEKSQPLEQITEIKSETKQSDLYNEPLHLPVEPIPIKCTKPDDLVTPLQEDTTELSPATDTQLLSSDLTQAEDKHTKQKPNKKRKKSPRLLLKPEEIKAEQPEHKLVATENIEKQTVAPELDIQENKKEEMGDNKAHATIEVPKVDDIEIRSLKADESEGSGCDATPDVLYPRSTSQQNLDDNNNMVIREVMPTENVLNMPVVLGYVDTPKTPEPTPEKNIEGDSSKPAEPFKMRKIHKSVDANTGKEEKTDLKSKMMEVNQDMEELRISIEKSLAELTSIEKSEEAVEKKYKEATETSKVAGVGQITEMKTEENVSVSETSISLSENRTGITLENETLEINTGTAVDKNNLKYISELPKDKAKVSTFEPKTEEIKIEEIIETALLTEEKSCKNTQSIKHIEETPLIPTITSVDPITGDKSEEGNENKNSETKTPEQIPSTDAPPICPARKDHKGRHKKKKGKQDGQSTTQSSSTTTTPNTPTSTTESKETKESKKDDKSDSKSDNKEKGKQQADIENTENDYEPIDNFEDALTSSVDDVNKTFEMIVNEANEQTNPKINIIAPDEEKTNKVQPPKNLLGHPDIPVQSNKPDYKKEKNRIPNESQAKVKIKDAMNIEKSSKNTQTFNKIVKNSNTKVNGSEDYVYKYNFRKVFLQSACHVCKKELDQRVACGYCNLVFYCSVKHKDEDWPQHQALCFAVSTIVHLKDQKHLYTDAKNVTGHDYRLLRMQMIVSCEKVLKRRLVPWEQEALLYPRLCALVGCRQWRQGLLKDCEGCGQISYCSDSDHLPKAHQRWCKSYSLYQKLVCYQQTKGRLEPKLPSRVMQEEYQMPEKMNEVLASMYEEKIDMNDIEYAALTQIATAPLTAAFSHQLYRNKMNTANGVAKKASCTVHVVGAELQFEADALNKWEVFFLHLRPDLQELTVVLVNSNLNPSHLPLELLAKIKLCENCRQKKRRVVFHFQDEKTYSEYRASDDFVHPDIVCAFNPSIQRSSVYNGKDPWPSTIKTIIKLKTPWLVTGYTIAELHKDTIRIKECLETPFHVVSEPKLNCFASVRPDRNFISDDEMPLLFKNYCYTILCG